MIAENRPVIVAFRRKNYDVRMAKYIKYHKDGSIWAKGSMVNGVMEGSWEWFRKNGTKMRSGSFKKGAQTGEWITFDSAGRVVKVTDMSKRKK